MSTTPRRHVFVCVTEYGDFFAGTIAKKRAQAAAMSEAERQRIREAVPEEHADGHRGLHCGQTIGGQLYEAFMDKLKARGLENVVLSPNACVAQHVAGCIVMVYPDGIWYRVHDVSAVDRIIDEHLVAGRPVADLIHRTLEQPQGCGLPAAASGARAAATR